MDEEDLLLNEADLEDVQLLRTTTSDQHQHLDENSKHELNCDLLLEFMQVAIHQVLCVRNLYPKQVFVKRKKYGIPVFMSCHPELNTYIQNVIGALKPLIVLNVVSKVCIDIKVEGELLEQYVFEINKFSPQKSEDDEILQHLEQHFRAALLKIVTCGNELSQLSGRSSTFEFKAYIKGENVVDLLYDNEAPITWLKSQDESPSDGVLKPLKSICDSALIQMQLLLIYKK